MAAISLRQVRKSFGKTEVIHGVDCDIHDGEFLVVVGPSGCGKSTLLRMIAGLETVTSGEIAIGGTVVNNLEPAERDIAMVFQNYALYPHMTVYNNMAYGLKNRRVPKAEIQARVRKAADILEIGELLQRKPRQLSGGQRQRVAMGRAIVREPSVFLFDEPLSNLDAKLRVQMRLEIKKLHDNLKITSVYVTHDQVEAMTLGHRLLVMHAGNVEQLGRPLELYERPMTTFVASFIGSPSMNLFAATLGRDGCSVELPSGERIPCCGGNEAAERAITLGIRPEHWQLVDTRQSMVQLHVDVVEELGVDTLVHGHLGATLTPLTVRVPGVIKVQAGETLPLAVAPQHVHVFAPTSGQRLN
jgi:sn-glycerol 3-phosphate transport system ATP-binding protein